MKITKLEEKGKNKFFLYLDDCFFATVDKAICEAFDLKVGDELEKDGALALLEESLVRKARERALYLLDAQAYTRKNLREKLLKTNDAYYADRALDQLEAAGVLNDLTYGRLLAEELIRTKFASNRKICEVLRRRGIEADALNEIRAMLPPDETKRVIALLRYSKALNAVTSPEEEKKLLASLLRKGYSFEAVNRALAFLGKENHED